jgi:hypothetical protein
MISGKNFEPPLRLGVLAAKKLPQRRKDTKNSQRKIIVSVKEFIYLVT